MRGNIVASKITDNTVLGDKLLIPVLGKYLGFSEEKINMCIELAESGCIAVESLLELTISKVGNLQQSIIDGQDFIDGSDAKKCVVTTISLDDGSIGATITNVKNKNGILRVVVSEPTTNKIYYFKIPNEELKERHNIKIRFSNFGGMPRKLRQDTLSWKLWNKYRVDTFEELCC